MCMGVPKMALELQGCIYWLILPPKHKKQGEIQPVLRNIVYRGLSSLLMAPTAATMLWNEEASGVTYNT